MGCWQIKEVNATVWRLPSFYRPACSHKVLLVNRHFSITRPQWVCGVLRAMLFPRRISARFQLSVLVHASRPWADARPLNRSAEASL